MTYLVPPSMETQTVWLVLRSVTLIEPLLGRPGPRACLRSLFRHLLRPSPVSGMKGRLRALSTVDPFGESYRKDIIPRSVEEKGSPHSSVPLFVKTFICLWYTIEWIRGCVR